MYGGGGGGQWPGQQQPQQTGYMQPQQTGYMGMQQQQQQRPMMSGMPQQQQQPTGMMGGGMMPQATGMGGMGMGMGMAGNPGLGGMRQPSYGMQPQQQQRFLTPQPQMQMQQQPTGMMQSPRPTGMQPQMTGFPGMQPQMTGYPGVPMGMQTTGLMPQMTGLPMDPRMQLMSAQFLPASQPYSGAPMAGNMNFNSMQLQPSNFQSQIQNLSQQQQGSKEPKIPWALSKDERKSYDAIFRAWDQKGTGFLNGEVAIEVFGQSGLERDKMMQIWHLSDTENRGKLNLAEFHVAMGLIYRALNGNDIPEHLPQELIPPSAKDLSESVDFLKDLLKRDANVRQTTALNLPEAGSNSAANYGKSRSLYEKPIQKQDAAAYKHTDEKSSGYKSSARHLDRRTVRYGGESASDDLSEMKRQLEQTQRMLDSQEEADEDDREVEKEMEDLRFRIKRVQDDIDYYNRRGGRDAAENRRRAERDLLHLMHERLPLLEKRLEAKDKKKREKNLDESRDRDRRNEDYVRGGRYSDRYNDTSRSQTPTQRDQDRYDRGSSRGADESRSSHTQDRAPPPPPSAPEVTKPAPAPPAPPSVAAVSAPVPAPSTAAQTKNMTPEERQAWIRSEAQRRIAERMRALGAAAPSGAPATPDTSVEQRLAADKAEAEARAAQADADAAAREEARRARLEEQRLERERAAVTTVKAELKEQEKSDNPPPALVMQAARDEVNEQEEMLRRREEVLQKEKEERLARFKKLEEEEADAKRQEEAFKQRQAQFSSPSGGLPAPARKGKSGPPPPPPTRARAAPSPSTPKADAAAPPPAPTPPAAPLSPTVATAQAVSTPGGGSSTNPFHRMQPPNGAAPVTSPSTGVGGTNPFYRQQQGGAAASPSSSSFTSSLPAPQRSTAAVVAGGALGAGAALGAAKSTAPPRRTPDDDDDWGESEHGDQDDEDPDGPGSTSRATRQNLAAALFSGLVSTPPPTSASPAPPVAPAAPAAPPAPVAAPAVPAPKGGAADVGALLGAIRGGASLRKAQTNDRSAAGLSGKVLGDASAPVQTFVPPPSPPAAPEPVAPAGDDSVDVMPNPNRQSVDWAGSLASDQMHAHNKASAMPDEPSLREEDEGEDSGDEGPENVDGPRIAAANGVHHESAAEADEADDFDTTTIMRVRTLYTYEGQRSEDLSFVENSVVLAHPSKNASSDWWYGSLAHSNKKGTFPRSYVQSIDRPKLAKALYDFEGSSPEELSFVAEQELHVVDDEDPSWWKVVDKQDRILIVPATYVELTAGGPLKAEKHAVSGTASASADELRSASMAQPASTVVKGGADAGVPVDDEDELQRVIRESVRLEREQSVARSREDKDFRRAMEISKQDATVDVEEQDDDDDDDSGYSTTGWTSSEEEDEDDDALQRDGGAEEQESEEAQRRRVAERMRVLEAAGILIVGRGKKDEDVAHEARGSSDGNAAAASAGTEVTPSAEQDVEKLLLHRRGTSKKKASRPERPERTIGEFRRERRSGGLSGASGGKDKPKRPARPPPPPPKEREPEEQMEDAYDRFVKLNRQVQQAQKELKATPLSAATPTSPNSPPDTTGALPQLSVSPPPASPTIANTSSSLSSTVAMAGSGLLSTIKSMSNRRSAAGSPALIERRVTPTISGPMQHRKQSKFMEGVGGSSVKVSPSDVASAAATTTTTTTTATSWTSLMGSEAVRDLPDVERKRQEAIFELITTESSHVRDVQIVVDVFFNAMQPLLQPKAATVIFGNIEEVLLASVSLLSDLEARQRSERLYVTQIGDVLQAHMSRMAVYIPYCVNQQSATHILQVERARDAALDALLVRLRSEHPAARGLDLSHFLLAPMQRLTRYPMLLSQIIKYTADDMDADETKAIRAALATAQRLLDTTNESIRQRESDERLAALSEHINASTDSSNVMLDLTQPTRYIGSRRVVREGVLQKQRSGRRVTVVLCNDVLLLLKGGGGGGTSGEERLYRMPMPLDELVVREVPTGLTTGRDDLAFQLVHQGRDKVNLRCSSARACHAWMHSIESARADCVVAASKMRDGSKRDSLIAMPSVS